MIQQILTPAVIIGAMGAVFGLGLAYASKVFAVEVDEKVVQIREVLPGANCGGCGYAGCDGFASAVASGTAKSLNCPVGGPDVASQIAKIMGVEATQAEKQVARVMCNGSKTNCSEKFEYQGIEDCFAASQVFAGSKSCAYGCLGLGNCVKACQFGALVIENGIARVNECLCVACGRCVEACPKKLIDIVPLAKKVNVKCRSKDAGAITRKNCKVGCIGCMKCQKTCPSGAISMEGPLAKIDPAKCTNCGECAKVCPTSAIVDMR